MDIITGYIRKIYYRNEKTGYTKFLLLTKDLPEYTDDSLIICCASIPSYGTNVPLKLEGSVSTSEESDFPIFNASLVVPYINNKSVAVNFLASGIVKHIGQALAEKIVNKTGYDLFSFVKKRDPRQELGDGFTERELSLFDTFIWKTRILIQENEVYTYIAQFGGSFYSATKISSNRTNALQALKKNPYAVGIPAGLKFNTCDLIFAHEGGTYYNENRLEWLVVKCLEQNENSGNTYAYIKNIMFWVNRLSKLSPVFNEEVPESLIVRACFNSKKIVCEQSSPEFRYYLKKTYYEEKSIVSHLQRIQSSKTPLCFNEKLIKAIEKKNNVTYAEKQKLAFELLKSTGIKVVTGGPGTGKTTTVNGLIQAYHKMYPNNTILLCAPTGRAAQRLSEATSKKAFTLHKALDIKPFGDNDIQSRTLESNPLEADFIIVDEMSMTDTAIFSILLGAIKSDTLVLLCGDTDQLPSVGAGNILHDIIASDFVEKVQLDVVYRQAKESGITENAIKVNSGKSDLVKKDDFTTYKLGSQIELSDKVCELVSCYYKKDDPFAVQVLSSTKQGDAGTVLLNRKLQMLCNENKTLTELEFNLKCGDKVMLTRNNYDIGYVNGDIGIITIIDSDYITIDIKGLAVTKVPRKYMSDISLAYAITIHKSQGSEYDTVVIALPSEPRVMLKRNLLYTAITRAKKRVILVTEQGSIEYAVNTLDTELRQTSILEKLIGQPKAIF